MKFDEKQYLLSYDSIDKFHMEFVDIYNSLKDTSNQSYINIMLEILEQTKRHFSHEEELMDKYNYPRSTEHKNEHKKVLAEIDFFIKKSASNIGQQLLKSYYNEKLPYSFNLHIISMDSDLAGFIKNR